MGIIQKVKKFFNPTFRRELVGASRLVMIFADMLCYLFWVVVFALAYMGTRKFQYVIGEVVVAILLPLFFKNWSTRFQCSYVGGVVKKDYLQTVPVLSLVGLFAWMIFNDNTHGGAAIFYGAFFGAFVGLHHWLNFREKSKKAGEVEIDVHDGLLRNELMFTKEGIEELNS